MQAITQTRYGSSDVLEAQDIPTPEIAADDVLIRVRAASIHLGDWILMTGSPFVMRFVTGLRTPRHQVPGTDIAGIVEAVGAAVTDLRPGDEVFGWSTGAFAEYARAPQGQVIRMPAGLSFEEAGAVGVSATTARSSPARRSSSTARPVGSARSRCRSPRPSAPMSPA